MRLARIATVGLVLLASPAWAVEPKAVIVGPTSTKVGRTVFLNASTSAFDAQYPLKWLPLGNPGENRIEGQAADPGGQVILFDQNGKANAVLAYTSERPGTFDFALIAKGKPEGSDTAEADVLIVRLKVEPEGVTPPAPTPTPGPAPNPTPSPTPTPAPPNPGPAPNPTPTNAWLGIVRDGIDQVGQPKDHKVACAKALAPWIRALAARQDVSNVPAFLEANRESVRQALGNNYDAWLPFRDAIKAGLDESNRAMLVLTLPQYRAEWLKIADAVEAYQ